MCLECMPNLSVIVPVYNVKLFLSRCIESIFAQTYTNYELILVDDGSIDGSSAICDEYAATYHNIHVYHQSNQGPGACRNLGISKSSGKWLCFIDSDDWIEPEHFANFFKEIPKESTIISQGILFDFDGKYTQPFFKYEEDSFLLCDADKVIKNRILHNGCPVCKLFNKRIIKDNNILFNTEISIHEDHLFVFEYLKYVDEIRLIDSLSYHYVRRCYVHSLVNIKHTADEHITFYNCFIKNIDILSARMCLTNSEYISSLYNLYGLNSLLLASLEIDAHNYKRIINQINLRNDLIGKSMRTYLLISYLKMIKKMPQYISIILIHIAQVLRKVNSIL